jgi:two-component system response regulator FixJ
MDNSAVVHLIDDDEAVRQALAFLLASAGHAVRVYESGESFLGTAGSPHLGCIVSDVRMPGIDGLALLRRLKEIGITLPVVIMTGHADVPLAVEAMKAGAVDFIEKPFDDEVLLSAIRVALSRQGEVEQRNAEQDRIRARIESLSERERQVLDGLVSGHANKTIAYDLDLSPRTVEVHRANVMIKMGASSLSNLVRMALIAKLQPQ